ncbi:MAG: hypothetical protein ONB07_02940 [candidate division KSB1 bacterium]|nr:hypothetical protein [candidate division KSB1 bacterium]
MPKLLLVLYNLIAVPLLKVAVGLGRLINGKVRRAVVGRRNLFVELPQKLAALDPHAPRLWIHACSMGEFEQARPVVAAVRERLKPVAVVLSVTSPSVYGHIDHKQEADVVTYLPVDGPLAARRFVRLVRPDVALVVRHDIWPNHLGQLQRYRVPSLLIDASLSPKIAPETWRGRLVGRLLYGGFDYILTTAPKEVDRLRRVAGRNPHIVTMGDTRYDQVQRRALENDRVLDLQTRFRQGPVLVAGSTWPADDKYLLPALTKLRSEFPQLQVILVPHEPHPEHLSILEGQLANHGLSSVRLSAWRSDPHAPNGVLVVDEMGILANIYSVADLAYVGGGFTSGVHSVLEPAVYGIPVLFGPRHQNSLEALELASRGGGFCVTGTEEMTERIALLLRDEGARIRAGREARAMVQERLGATARIVDLVESLLKERKAEHIEGLET